MTSSSPTPPPSSKSSSSSKRSSGGSNKKGQHHSHLEDGTTGEDSGGTITSDTTATTTMATSTGSNATVTGSSAAAAHGNASVSTTTTTTGHSHTSSGHAVTTAGHTSPSSPSTSGRVSSNLIPSISTMLPKHLLVGRDDEVALLCSLYDKCCDVLQRELQDITIDLLDDDNNNDDGKKSKTKNHNSSEQQQQKEDEDDPSSSHYDDDPPNNPSPNRKVLKKTNSGDTLITGHGKKKTLKKKRSMGDSSGSSVLVHLQGKPGVGKTSLVNQFVRQIKEKHASSASSASSSTAAESDTTTSSGAITPKMSTSSSSKSKTSKTKKFKSSSSSSSSASLFVFRYKYNQFGNTQPMESIISIMNILAYQIISCDNYSNKILRNLYFEKLKESCGDILISVLELMPIYSKILSKELCCSTTSIPDSLRDNVSKTLYPAISSILEITRLYMAQLPIIIFLDDIQWIDPGSKSCLQYLVTNSTPIYLIIAFRDLSSQSTFTLDSLIPKTNATASNENNGTAATSGDTTTTTTTTNAPGCSSKRKLDVVGIELSEFTYDHVSQLLSYLNIQPSSYHELLTKFLYHQTDGNQFYLQFRLHVMAETGALMYYPGGGSASGSGTSAGYWKLDQELINLGMQMSDDDNEDAIEFCGRIMQTQLPKYVVAVLCRIALMPQGKTIDELTNILQYDTKLISYTEGSSSITTASNGKDDDESKGGDNSDSSRCMIDKVRDILERALTIAVQKSILYQHAPSNSHNHHHNHNRRGGGRGSGSNSTTKKSNKKQRGGGGGTSTTSSTTGGGGGGAGSFGVGSGDSGGSDNVSIDGTNNNVGGLSLTNAAFSFAHDRLQQSAAQCVTNEEELSEIHYYLGLRRLYCTSHHATTTTATATSTSATAAPAEPTTTTTRTGASSNASSGSSSHNSGGQNEGTAEFKGTDGKPNKIYRQVSSIEDGGGMMDDEYWGFDGGDGHEDVETMVINSSFMMQQQKKQRDVEAFEILHHFQNARSLVLSATHIKSFDSDDTTVKGRDDLIWDIGQLAAQACGYYVTAGSHEQFDSMIQFVRELIETVLRKDDSKNTNEVQSKEEKPTHDFEELKNRLLIAHHQIKYLMNDLSVAEELFNEVKPRLSKPSEIRDAYFTRIALLVNDQNHPVAISTMGEALAKLKEESVPGDLVLPEGQPTSIVLEVTQKIKDLFTKNADWDVEDVANSIPVSDDEDHNFRVEIMISCIASFYLVGRFDLYLYIPSVACLKVLEKGLTRSSGHSFAVLGFALCAMFGDSFGAEVAMIGKHLVDRFDNPTCVSRALVLSGMAVIYDRRYENLAVQQYYTSYVAGRTAHEILWACYGVYLLSCHLRFEGTVLPEMVDMLDDMVAYVKSDGHQILATMGCRSILHATEMLMYGKSDEGGPVFHFSIPDSEINKLVPLIPFTHAAASIHLLYFDDKFKIAWELIQQVLDQGLDQSAPGIPIIYTFHLFTVLVCRGILVRATSVDEVVGTSGNEETNGVLFGSSFPVSDDERTKLKDVMVKSVEYLEERFKMAPIFTAHAGLARGCALEILDDRPWEALKEFEKAVDFISEEKRGKHNDLVAVSNLLSADIFGRQGLATPCRMYQAKAVAALKKWGADYIAKKLSKNIAEPTTDAETETERGIPLSGPPHYSSGDSITSSATPLGSGIFSNTMRSHSGSGTVKSHPKRHRDGPDFAAILSTASYIASFNSFDELVGKLSSALLKQATATRLLLLVRHTGSDVLEPTAQCANDILSPMKALSNVEYSSSIVKISDLLKESVVIHSAQQESPYCFESYIQRSKVQSVACMPIMHQGSVIAVVYMEHDGRTGVFTPDIMATMALLGQNVASAIVNARLLRDLRKRTAQLEQSHTFLAKALRVKDTILSNTSHELRSPLHGIIGLNECVATSDIELHPEVNHCINSTLAMSRRLLNLVTDILDLSRIGEGSLTLNYETTALKPLVEKVFGEARFAAGNNVGEGTSLVNNVDPLVEIMVDPTRMKQVLLSLISNAIKFTPEGTVTVTGEYSDDKSMVVVSVSDTGIGIEQSHLDFVFDPFFQASSYETRNHQGAGLGLSITKQLVELHGGRIDVASKVGAGSTFQVFIPTTPPTWSEIIGQPMEGESPSLAATPLNNVKKRPDSIDMTPKTPISTGGKDMPTMLPSMSSEKLMQPEDCMPRISSAGSSHSLFSLVKPRDQKTPVSLKSDKFLPLPKKPSTAPSNTPTKLFRDTEESTDSSGMATTTVRPPSIGQMRALSEAAGSLLSMDSMDEEPLRVFAVDDTAVNLKVLTNFLKKADMVVTTATDGKQLLDKLEGAEWTNYDVILLDWMMPVMDGITACKLLRQRIPSDLLPVIFLTAKTDPGAAAKGFEAGGTDFATKPLNRHEVIARTTCQGLASRRARARYFESIPIAHLILTKEPFWKMHPASADRDMFVICLRAESEGGRKPSTLDGSNLLHFFQLEPETAESDWRFCELCQDSVSFLAMETTTSQITKYVQTILSGWAESQLINSTSAGLSLKEGRPVITIGVDYRPVRAHLFGERQPMLAAVETCTMVAKDLAKQATDHEQIVLSDTARLALGNE